MENTEDLEIDIDDIGTILKSSRLKQKKSMEDISSELCIRKIYLTALEESDYETLPPVPYGIGYVRTYARYLGLNPERAVKLYKAASQTDDVEKEEEKNIPEPEKNNSSSRHIIVGIFALAVVYGGWSLYTINNIAPKLMVPVSEELVASEEVTILEKADEPVIVEEEIVEEDGADIEEPEEPAVEETVAEETSAPEEEVPPVVLNNVVLEFTGETWVELKDKKKVYFQGVFHEGDKKEIDYVDNLFLSVGRPNNVDVYIKGVKKDILVKKRKMNIPLDSLD